MFLSEPDIVSDLLLRKWTEPDKQTLKNTPYDDLIMYHHSVGMWIRNSYLLWDPNNPIVDHRDSMSDNFPDQISQRIIETCWKKLQQFA